jgi:hypothetical protein
MHFPAGNEKGMHSLLRRDRTTAKRLPEQREYGVDVRFHAVKFAPDHHAFFRAVAVSVLYHNVRIDPCLFPVRTGHMELAGLNGKMFMFLGEAFLHICIVCLLSKYCKAFSGVFFFSCSFKQYIRKQQCSFSDSLQDVRHILQ